MDAYLMQAFQPWCCAIAIQLFKYDFFEFSQMAFLFPRCFHATNGDSEVVSCK